MPAHWSSITEGGEMSTALKLWNGRWLGNRRIYVAAYSVKDAVDLAQQARDKLDDGWWNVTVHEVTKYWSRGWGNQMNGVGLERGAWIARDWFSVPDRVV